MKIMNVLDQERLDALVFDYVEGDLDPSMRKDFQSLIQKDEQLQKRVREIGGLRRQMKNIQTDIPPAVARLDALHDRIMKQVNETQPQPRILAKASSAFKLGAFSQGRVWQTAAAAAFALLATIAVLAVFNPRGNQPRFVQHTDKTINQVMVETSLKTPGAIGDSDLSSSEDQIDMYLDVVAKRMGHMNDRENQQLLNQLKE